MKRILSNWRYWALAALATAALLGLASVPSGGWPEARWLLRLVLSKGIGLSAGALAALLAREWEKRGAVPELTAFLDRTQEGGD